jgi:hypothetical protein
MRKCNENIFFNFASPSRDAEVMVSVKTQFSFSIKSDVQLMFWTVLGSLWKP